MSSDISFPSPVGGVSLSSDFAPSIFFALLYASLLPIFFKRLANKRSRAILSVNAVLTVIERIVIFSLRAWQSRTPAKQTSPGLATYMQVTISLAYIAIAQDSVQLLRCLYVNSTKGPAPDYVDSAESPVGTTSSSQYPLSPARANDLDSLNDGAVQSDQPRQRFMYRRFTDVLKLIFLAATIPGIIGNAKYKNTFNNTSTGNQVMINRYVSSGIALALMIFVAVLTIRARHLPRVRPINIIFILAVLACTASSAIFRLAFMYHHTTSLISKAPGSGNTPVEKATFYIFHMLSDWMAIALLLVPNVREMFATGMWGDWRAVDPSPAELEWQRKRKEAKAQRNLV
ncbi:hypothetical protein HYDPIDRAFT_107161 [Hydnomerulius pinastri MD-312]|nr:hypothetical protein HYDPIDRAFT_107161 [Hydnomerulius pinastri MD-312]